MIAKTIVGRILPSLLLACAPAAGAATLTHVTTHTEGAGGITGTPGPFEPLVSPDGNHVYVKNSGDVLGVFARDPAAGTLTPVTTYTLGVDLPLPPGGWGAWAISPDGFSVLLGGTRFAFGDSHEFVVLSRNSTSGELTPAETHPTQGHVRRFAFSPDGEFVYVGLDADLQVFDRDTSTGSLTSAQSFSASKFFPDAVVATEDNLYAMTPGWQTIRVFDRNPATGEITLRQKLSADFKANCKIGQFACDEEGRDPRHLMASLDGAFLYGGGSHRGSERGPLLDTWRVTGDKLEPVDRQFLDQCYDPAPQTRLVPHPDGARVFGDDAVFSVDPVSGAISLLESFTATITTAGLTDPTRTAVSPDGQHYYVAGLDDASIAVFSIGASPAMGPTRNCRYWGSGLVVRNSGPGGVLTSIKWKAAGTIGLPVEGSSNDPRCNGAPAGTVKATLRFASTASGRDTGAIPLPCENWSTFGKAASLKRGYRYDDRRKDAGPCNRLLLKGKKFISATCDNKGPSALSYSLSQGVSEDQIDAVLQVGELRYCTRYDGHNGADGSDGKKFNGKKDPQPHTCPVF